ncbi:MAG: hypothetical protein V3U79_08140 [Dehalococcoidia bacterium]
MEGEEHENEGHVHYVNIEPSHEEGGHPRKAPVIEDAEELTLVTTEWAFTPDTLTAKFGEPITIILLNEGIIDHEVQIPAFGFHLHAEAGTIVRGDSVPDQIGTFELAC